MIFTIIFVIYYEKKESLSMIFSKKSNMEPSLSELSSRLDDLTSRRNTLVREADELQQQLSGVDTRYLVTQSVADTQHSLEMTHIEIASLDRLINDLDEQYQAQHAKQGKEVLDTTVTLFKHLDRDIALLHEGLQELQQRRSELAREAEEALSEQWPGHWQAFQRSHIPREDGLSRIARSALNLRLAISDVSDPFALQNDSRLAPIWYALSVSIDEVINGRFSSTAKSDLIAWLDRYRTRDI